jgi:hypothetical protein
MDAFLSRKRKEPPATSMALPPSAELDERARHLMEKVEALAKGNGDGSDLDRCSSSSVARRSALHDPIGESLPMLVRNTESGVYIKWSLMLQDELSRIKLAYEQLKAENAFLQNRLEAAEGAPAAAAAAAAAAASAYPSTGQDYTLERSKDQSSSFVSAKSAALTEHNLTTVGTNSGGAVAKETTPPTSEVSRASCVGAEALIFLSSPQLTESPATSSEGISKMPLSEWGASRGAAAAAGMPPAGAHPSTGMPPAGAHPSTGMPAAGSHPSTASLASLGESDVFADLLSSPTIMGSPSFFIKSPCPTVGASSSTATTAFPRGERLPAAVGPAKSPLIPSPLGRPAGGQVVGVSSLAACAQLGVRPPQAGPGAAMYRRTGQGAWETPLRLD